jgi:hypothetical protein
MAIQVNFEYPYNSGIASGLTEFPVGSEIGLLVKSDNAEAAFTITIVWSDKTLSEYRYSGRTSLAGNANVPITLPDVATTGILVYESTSSLVSFVHNVVQLGLGVGQVAPVVNKSGTTPNWLVVGGLAFVGAVGIGLLVRHYLQ